MSGDDSEAGFLGRWAKRKAQVRAQETAELQETPAPQGDPAAETAKDEAEPFDLASLPSLEDITADTDVTAFLRREVPDFLRNAALKRAWAADPGIRDYVNPAMEYAFDWNVIGGVPGSGELEAGYDAASHVAKMFSTPLKIKGDEAEEGVHTLVAEVSTEALPQVEDVPALLPAPGEEPAAVAVRRTTDKVPVENEQKQISAEPDVSAPESVVAVSHPSPSGARRRHGGAAPA